MRIGIDIGGTHTDGVVIDNHQIISKNKITTDHNNLTDTILSNCKSLIKSCSKDKINQVTLSTTLATNLIAQENFPPVGLLLIPGPGINPDLYTYNFPYQTISGYIDHRGRETKSLNEQEIIKAVNKLINQGIRHIGVCGKFSTRNSAHEFKVKKVIEANFPEIRGIALSHQLSGELNFPRRTATTYLNCAVQDTQKEFTNSINEGFNELNIKAPIYLLKADGGTMPLKESETKPVTTINSGPAASIMGIMSAKETKGTTLGIDIGGTTTDISLFIKDDPLFKPEGIEIKHYKTLVRGLYNSSLPYGGDSLIKVKDGSIKVGPERKGPAAAFGGSKATPTDALVLLEKINSGSKEKAGSALKPIARKLGCSLKKTAQKIISSFCSNLKEEINQIINYLNQQPVYTINELLTDKKVKPTQIIGIGGPAKALIPKLADELNLNYIIPDNAEVTNAIGAALAKITTRCTLYADTSEGYYNIPELGIQKKISRQFNLEKARQTARKKLKNNLSQKEKIEITEEESFNIVRGFNTLGQIIKVTAQVKPGLDD